MMEDSQLAKANGAGDGATALELLNAHSDLDAPGATMAVICLILERGDIEQIKELAMKGWALQKCLPQEEVMGSLPENVKVKLAELIGAQSEQTVISRRILDGSGPVEAEHLKGLGPLVTGLTSDGMSLLHQAVVCQRPDVTNTILAVAPDSINILDYAKRSPLHYAALCPPGTEIYQTLKNAGANEVLLDVLGKSPLDYAADSNSALLEEMKDKMEQRLKALDVVSTPAAEEGKHEPVEEKFDEETGNNANHNSTKEHESQPPISEDKKGPAGPKQIKPLQMYVSRRSCQRDPPAPPPCTVDGRYIAQHLGEALTKAMAEIAEVRPCDPIEYLARWLYKYRRDEAFALKQEELLKTIRDEEARLVKEEELKFKRMEEFKRYQEEEADKRRIEEEERKKKEQEELMRSAKESALAQKPALPTVSEEAEEMANDDDDDREEDDDTSVKDRDSDGQTELHKLAAQQGIDFTALIQLGYSIADRDINGKTARDIAQENGQKENVRAIDDYLKKVLEDGREDVLEQLVLEGFDGLETVEKSNLPEVTRASLDKLTSLREVIETTMKNAISRDEQAENEALEAVDAQPLLAKAKDEAGRSLMHLAVLAGTVKLVTHLASSFPDTLKARDNFNRTPLHYACGTSTEMTELLLSKGASLKAKDALKKRPIFYKTHSSDIKALQASLGLAPKQPPIPEVTIGEVEPTSAESAADDTTEEAHLATVIGAESPNQQTTEGLKEQQQV